MGRGVDAQRRHQRHFRIEIGFEAGEIAFGEEAGDEVAAAHVLAEGQDLEAFALALGEAVERGHFDHARATPGRPEIDQQRPAAEGGEIDRAALRVLEVQLGRDRAGMAAVEPAGGVGGRRIGRRVGGIGRRALRGVGLLPIASA